MKWYKKLEKLTKEDLKYKAAWDAYSLNPEVRRPGVVGFTQKIVISNVGPGGRWKAPSKKKQRQYARYSR